MEPVDLVDPSAPDPVEIRSLRYAQTRYEGGLKRAAHSRRRVTQGQLSRPHPRVGVFLGCGPAARLQRLGLPAGALSTWPSIHFASHRTGSEAAAGGNHPWRQLHVDQPAIGGLAQDEAVATFHAVIARQPRMVGTWGCIYTCVVLVRRLGRSLPFRLESHWKREFPTAPSSRTTQLEQINWGKSRSIEENLHETASKQPARNNPPWIPSTRRNTASATSRRAPSPSFRPGRRSSETSRTCHSSQESTKSPSSA
ncbi:hypothetical protein VTK73DRAFT_3129 [Phialemonium thermophilum]|uniref:Uncharacterized protein n=1 Tax=Phialemonium thermophilum TaxID=223376 RepID=A0ABR3VKF9_9PEZI